MRVSPDLLDLEHADGIVPAGGRVVRVSLRRSADGFHATLEGAGEDVEVIAASGLELTSLTRDEAVIRASFRRLENEHA